MRNSDINTLPELLTQTAARKQLKIGKALFKSLKKHLSPIIIESNPLYDPADIKLALDKLKQPCPSQSITNTDLPSVIRKNRRTGTLTSQSTVSPLERAVEQTISRKPKRTP